MTNIDTFPLAQRLEALGHAVHKHNESAEPREMCGDPEQFWRTAEMLRIYPDSKLAQLITRSLLGLGELAAADAEQVEKVLIEANKQGLQKIAMIKAVYDLFRVSPHLVTYDENTRRLREVLVVWGQPLREDGGLLLAAKRVTEFWAEREGVDLRV